MIIKLNNFTHKSFVDYTNPDDLLFRSKNILFGYNGKGKSSTAIGIKVEYLKDPNKKIENLRIFDRDYISNSLLLENSDEKIKGIEASFGKGSVDIENKIKELENELVGKDEIDKIDLSVEKLRKEIRKGIDTIHERRKGEANIQKKPKDESVTRVIELYKKDYTDAKKIEFDDDKLIKINGDNSIEKQIFQFENLSSLVFSKIHSIFIADIKIIFEEKFGEDISIPEYEVVKWIESGLKIHKEGDNCKFCNSHLDYSDIKLKITQYKENKKHQATEKLKQFKKELQNLLENINLFEKESKIYSAIIGNVVDQYFTIIIEQKNKIDLLIKTCQSKIEKIENQEHFDFQLLTEILNEIDESITYVNKIKIHQITELRKKHLNLTTLVKGAIGLEILKSVIIKEKLKEVKLKEEELKEKRDNNSKKQKEIQDFKQQKSLTKDFADFVSLILTDINISLKVSLDSDNRNYIIKSTNENATLTIKNISEGEKNLLSLLFFYYELFADNIQQQIKTDIELIIVDDPISSMDDSNKFYILELVKNLLELPNQQVFVLTHSWEDYCNISYGRKSWENNQPYATFELRKNSGRSEFSKLKNIEKPYKYLFKEIFVFSQKAEGDIITDCQIYHYPNVMRRVFEEWYSFKIGKDLNLTSAQQERITSDLKITENREKTKLGLLLKVCNILSHSINGSKNPQEIHQASKFLMKLISANDKLHYDNMKQ
jgi:wobble nucleotide-excising tRNase